MPYKKQRHRGQALVLFLGFSAAMVALFLVAFNSGQVTNAKMRAMNAADAAAYSGAVWQARTLNFQAYINRAMIVNEVTIAQAVSLKSWMAYLDQFATNVNIVTAYIPPLGRATTHVKRVIDGLDTTTKIYLAIVDKSFRGYNAAEHSSGQVLLNTFGTLVAQDLASEVAKLNGAELSPARWGLFAENERQWLKLTKTYNKSPNPEQPDGRARMREVVLDSRDGFSHARDWTAGFKPVFNFRKQGGTDLINYDAWKGLDSARLNIGWNFFKGRWITSIPLAWGGAQSYSPNPKYQVGRHGNINEWWSWDGQLANMIANGVNAKSAVIPFQGYRDIKDLQARADKSKDPFKLPFSAEVVIKKDAIPVAGSALNAQAAVINGPQINADPHFMDEGVYALSTACVSFERPFRAPRSDGQTEYPSLFNPYWRASLATEGKAARVIADASKKLFSVSNLLGGDTTCG